MIQTFCGYTGLINFVACLSLSILVYFWNRSAATNRIFAIWSLSVAFWSFGYYIWLFRPNHESALFWIRVLMGAAIVIPTTFLHFVVVYLRLEGRHRPLIVFGYLFTLVYLGFDFTPHFIQDVEPRYWFTWWPVPGILFHFYVLYFISVVAYAHYLLFQQAKKATSELTKRQLRTVAFSTLMAYAGGSTNFFLWYNIPVPPAFNFLVTAYVALIAHAILHYQLWNIELFIRRTVVFTGLITFVYGVFLFGLFVVQKFLAIYLGLRWEAAVAISIFLTVLGYEPMRAFLIEITDKYLFQKKYDYRKLLKDAAMGIAQIESLNYLLKLVTHFITMRVRVRNAAVLTLDLATRKFRLGYQRGYPQPPVGDFALSSESALIRCLEEEKEPLEMGQVRDSIETGRRGSSQKGSASAYDFSEIQHQMEKLQAACCIPSFLGRELRNILILGEKKSRDPYSQEDLNVLFTLAQQSAIAIENARLYDEAVNKTRELQKINRDLESAQARLVKALEETERANKELRNTQAQLILEQKMATLGRLAASVGHEVNNPLTILSMNVSRSILKYKKDPDLRVADILDLFEKMEQNIARIKAVVSTLTGLLKKSEKGKFEPLSLKLILEETLPLVQFQTYLENPANTDVEFDVPSSLPLIRGDLEGIAGQRHSREAYKFDRGGWAGLLDPSPPVIVQRPQASVVHADDAGIAHAHGAVLHQDRRHRPTGFV